MSYMVAAGVIDIHPENMNKAEQAIIAKGGGLSSDTPASRRLSSSTRCVLTHEGKGGTWELD